MKPHMRIYIFIIISAVTFLSATSEAFAEQKIYSGGHYAVTLPKDCAALQKDDGATPAIHYMENAYKRCQKLSRQLMHETAVKKAEDQTLDKNTAGEEAENTSIKSQNNELPVSKKHYRVTPVQKEKE